MLETLHILKYKLFRFFVVPAELWISLMGIIFFVETIYEEEHMDENGVVTKEERK